MGVDKTQIQSVAKDRLEIQTNLAIGLATKINVANNI